MSGDLNRPGRVEWISTMKPARKGVSRSTQQAWQRCWDTDRVRPFADYCIGLLSAEGRKSVEPPAAVTAPERTAAQHQSLLHFVAQAPWSDRAMLRRVRLCCMDTPWL
jgi:SRSO17 transposase